MNLREAIESSWPFWEDDPVAFADDVLGRTMWSKQIEIANLVANNQKVTVRSGHKTGKSATAAPVGLWWAATRPGARVIITAPTNRQVEDVIWREVVHLYRNAKIPLGGRLYDTPQKGWRGPNGSQLIGFSTDDPDKFSGFSSADMFLIADEAAGIKRQIFEAISGVLASGGKLLMLGNPTQQSGEFYDSFHTKRSQYKRVHVSSLEVPNITGIGTPIRGLATKQWADDYLEATGPRHPIYQVRVLGDFATEGNDVVISLSLVEASRLSFASTAPMGRLHIGVDVARYGDDLSCIAARRGNRLMPLVIESKQNTVEIAARVMSVVKALRLQGEKPVIMVDEIGVGGGVVDILYAIEKQENIEVVGVNVSCASDDDEKFHNLRAQLHFGVADWLKRGGAINDERLEAELIAAKFKFDARGRLLVEPKDDIKERLGRSPDRADALALCCYEGGWRPKALRVAGL